MSTPFTNASGSTSDGRKRPGMVDDGAASSLVKRARSNYHNVLASESSNAEEEGTESVHSIQDKETDYCKDTTDTDTKSESMVEYEVVSSSDTGWQLRTAVSSSGADVLVTPRALASSKLSKNNIDICTAGDKDDDETDSVSSLSAAPLVSCQICQKRKENPSKNTPIAKNHIQPRALASDKLNASFNLLASQDSGASCSSLLEPLPREPISSNCYLATHPTLASWASAASELCIMCKAEPKNGIFVHTTGGHMCCCYACALKFWSTSKRCAWCNLKAKSVIKGYIG